MNTYLELVLNLSLLISLSLVSGFIEKRWPQRTMAGIWLQGVLFGVVSVVGMLKPLVISPGLFFDGRTVMISLCSLFFGYQAAIIAMVQPIVCRIIIGGPGVYMGVGTVLSSAAIGLMARKWILVEQSPPSVGQLYGFGIVVHVVMLAWTITLPVGIVLSSLQRIGLPVILAYPIATVLAGKVLSDQLRSIQRERVLQKTKQQLDITLHSIADGIISVDTECRVQIMNPAAEQLTGWSQKEAFGRPLADIFHIIHTETREIVRNPVDIVLEKGEVVGLGNHTSLITKDGTERNIADSAAPIRNEEGGIEGAVFVFRDVTEEYRLQQELIQSEENYRRIFEDHAAVKLIIDPKDGRIVKANQAAAAFYGWSIDELTRMRIQDIDSMAAQEAQGELLKASKAHRIHFECQHRLADGSIREVAVYNSRIRMKEGDMLHAIVHDITDRKRLEEERKADQERIRAILNAAADPIVVYDVEGCPVFINPAFSRVFGWTIEELSGRRIPYVPEDQEEPTSQKLREMIETGVEVRMETRRFAKDGKELHVLVSAAPMRTAQGKVNGFVACLTDITRIKHMEKEIREAQKMEAIGALAAGIAHDFNNILFPISGLAQISLWDAPKGSDLQKNLERIYDATRRASDLVQQILTFSRKTDIQRSPVTLQTIVKEVFKLTRASIPTHIEMTLDLPPQTIRILGDATQMHQVLMNLITNAFHAVESEGGSIHLSLGEVTIESDLSVTGGRIPPGQYAKLTVSDTGHGIDRAIIDNIFEPYFTTKPQGKGTGLGLAVVRGIVTELGGWIDCTSQVGSGTTMSIFLPLLEKREEAVVAGAPLIEVPTGSDRILLVDDEKSIAEMERRMLERLGYTVSSFTSSEEALRRFEENPQDFDVVLTDLSMPKPTGIQLAQRMLAIRPDIPIILCTGYSDMIDANEIKDYGIRAVAPKPLAVEVLAVMIRQVLGSDTSVRSDSSDGS
ncbi:MAG: PAS domain S-box protein [Thermodesulfobacteriota bacterium]